ncbi:hypothetical protein DMENIID0001_167940 [Sergentomyia squamirostris]
MRLVVLLVFFVTGCCSKSKIKWKHSSTNKAGTSSGTSDEVKYPDRPHIIILMADDMGFNDVSFHGSSQILTPNIDALAYQGVILNRHYTPSLCTPSRASLLTGMNPVHIGMQYGEIFPCDPEGLPLNLKILPQYLKPAGYRSHLVGKWHLGFARRAYTPTERGFDSFFGFFSGTLDYYNHTTSDRDFVGYDFRRNLDITYEGLGNYTTDLFTNESIRIIRQHNTTVPLLLITSFNAPHAASDINTLEAPESEIDTLNYIPDREKRTYAAMVTIMDRGIGMIIKELDQKKMLSNSIILFYSDNGAPTRGLYSTRGSNFPLRGQKYSPWEGGLRAPAAVWSPMMEVRHGVSNQLIHNSDWLPTFLAMTGSRPVKKLYGFDIWPTLQKNLPSPRREIIHNIDPIDGYSSFYYNGWKYINGTTVDGIYDGWLGSRSKYPNPMANNYANVVMASDTWQSLSPFALRQLTARSINKIRKNARVICQPKVPYAMGCNPLMGPCLFKIIEDPCELNNLISAFPMQAYLMNITLTKERANIVYPINLSSDYWGCNPALYNGTFTWWLDLPPTTLPNTSLTPVPPTLPTISTISTLPTFPTLSTLPTFPTLSTSTNSPGNPGLPNFPTLPSTATLSPLLLSKLSFGFPMPHAGPIDPYIVKYYLNPLLPSPLLIRPFSQQQQSLWNQVLNSLTSITPGPPLLYQALTQTPATKKRPLISILLRPTKTTTRRSLKIYEPVKIASDNFVRKLDKPKMKEFPETTPTSLTSLAPYRADEGSEESFGDGSFEEQDQPDVKLHNY